MRHDGSRRESAEKASSRGQLDVALLSILRDGLMRRSEAAALTWADVELRENGTALLQVHRSKTDPEGEGIVLYIGKEAGEALRAIRPTDELLDLNAPVFGLSSRQIGRRVQAAAKAAGLGEGFTGHSGRVGMAQDLVKSGVERPALMTADRWKSAKMPARYTERQAAHRSAAGPAHPPGPYPGNERRQLPPQGQPAGCHRILCTGAGWRVALPWPSAHGARSHANAKIRIVSHYLGGTLSLRHSC